MERDHARLARLLQASIDSDFTPLIYNEFRTGLLRHIAIEEKLLFPNLRSNEELTAVLTQLRLQHGALGALLVPKATRQIVQAIQHMLEQHNKLEEGDEGVYSKIVFTGNEGEILSTIKAFPDVPLSAAIDKLTDMGPVRRAMERAGINSEYYF